MFYQNFEYLCDSTGIKKSNVCKKLAMSENAWKKWELGSNPRNSTVLAIARFFGVAYDDLLHTDLRNKSMEDDEVLKARQQAFERGEIRTLFDLATKAPASKIYEAIAMLQKYAEENKN